MTNELTSHVSEYNLNRTTFPPPPHYNYYELFYPPGTLDYTLITFQLNDIAKSRGSTRKLQSVQLLGMIAA